ncbi:filamentous hemagglutinin N-terminal domain-containing protein [Bordetella hinzii]|uniref:YDG domain-containing protein n=1 Tax=Bordetella hinzii TaxID=103855 RepID=UPI001C00C0E4|nr:YDG domain-containing protein [Bordetella hinzii]QWF51196.1 filamentous hemagglutinin N-terminal domain-containing protein [Bordetella hinzii]
MKMPSLNHIYRLVWNDSLGAFVPVAEHANSRRKRGRPAAAAVLSAALLASSAGLAADLPTGGQVVAGSGGIRQNGNTMNIDQSSGKLAIDWQSFSIGQGKTVNFNQPGRDAVALNRVLGSDVSVIQGALNANGQVFLVNPNGVLFTPTAQVNVGGLVASTLNISTADFLAGNYRFEGAGSNAIVNQGNITAAPGGSIALIAAKVTNTGTLVADRGNVLIGAGSRVKLDLGGPVKLEVEAGALDALIEQGGAIRADGGLVYLTAKAAGELASTVINHTGITQARTLATGEQGQIMLLGDMVNDRIAVGGTLDASAPAGGNGGFIETSAATVAIAGGANISTKAAAGKTGNWLIDPTDFTVSAGAGAAASGGIGADTLAALLQGTNVELQTLAGGGGKGDINVNAAVKWSADTRLTLSAQGDININAPITATGQAAGLALNYGGYRQNGSAAAGSDYYVNTAITLSGANATLAINGQSYTLLHSVADIINKVAAGNGRYALAQDIDMGGTSYTRSVINSLSGTFAGLGHTISNLTIGLPGNGSNGLFSNVTSSGTVRDLALDNAQVVGGSYAGTLAGENAGMLRNVSATGVLSGSANVGGLVGSNTGTIVNANARVTVTGQSGGFFIGGLVGNNGSQGVLDNVYATGNVSGGNSDIGGLAGVNLGTIRNAYALGNVSGNGNNSGVGVGGLVGSSRDGSSVTNAYASGKVNGSLAGGLVGYGMAGTLTNSHWDVTTTGLANAVGGFYTLDPSVTGINSNLGYQHASYTAFGNWSQAPGSTDVWVAKDAQGKAQWIMIEGQTRPMLASEYSVGIGNDHQLQLMAYKLDGEYFLTRDFAMQSQGMWGAEGFQPIGNSSWLFSGSLDGQGHVIRDVNITRYQTGTGLFGWVDVTGLIRDVGLVNAQIQGANYTGALAGYSIGTLIGSFAMGSQVKGLDYLGGLVGWNKGLVENVYFDGTVSNNFVPSGFLGGVVGWNSGTVRYAYGNADFSQSLPGILAGGVTGQNAGVLEHSFWNSDLTATTLIIVYTGATGKSAAELKQLSTFVAEGWSIDNAGGSDTVWRLYDGQSGPLLRAFLKPVTVSLAGKTYDGQVSGGTSYIASIPNAVLGGSITYQTSAKDAGVYTVNNGTLTVNGSLYSDQLGYDISYGDDLSLTIAKKGVSANYNALNKIYDGSADATVSLQSLDGLVSGDRVDVNAYGGMFTDKNAGNNKTVTISGISLSGIDAQNYYLESGSATAYADITPRSVSGSVTAGGKTYDGTTSATTSGTLTGVLGGDQVVFNTSGLFSDKNAGTGKTVYLSASLGGLDAQNYSLSGYNLTTLADIAKLAITGAITAAGKTYDGTTSATTSGTLTGTVAGDSISLSTSGSFADKNAGTGKTVNVSGALAGLDAGNYSLTSVNTTTLADIAKLAITGAITAAGKTYDGTTSATTSGTLTGTVAGDNISLSTSGSFADKNAGTGKTVNVSGALAGLDAGNYSLTSVNTTTLADIAKLAISGAITAAGKTYDGTTTATTSGTLVGTVAGDNISLWTSGSFADKNAGAGKTVNVSGALAGLDAGNYSLSGVNSVAYADIAKLAITGAITAAGKTYDGTTSATTSGTLTGVLAGDNVAMASSGAFADKNAGAGKVVNVAGQLTGLDAGNYQLNANSVAYADIAKLAIAGAITASGKTYDGNTSASTRGILSGVLAGDQVGILTQGQFADRNAGLGKTVNVSGRLSGADADNYALSTNSVAVADIARRAITVTADNQRKNAGAADPALTWKVTAGSLVEGDTLQGALVRAPGETLGDYRISAAALANGNYQVSPVDGLLTISGVPLDTRRDAAISAAQQQDGPSIVMTAPPLLPAGAGPLLVSAPTKGGLPPSGAGLGQLPAGHVWVIEGGIRLPQGLGGI